MVAHGLSIVASINSSTWPIEKCMVYTWRI
jgi:hypothetical protein